MKRGARAFLTLLLLLSLSSCATLGGGGGGGAGGSKYEKDAIRLRLVADPKLNLFGGSPHTLLVCVYQLRDPNAFNQEADDKDGIGRLMECGRFDPTVAYTRKVFVQPGQTLTESIDRAEGARYVGVVAGYSRLLKPKAVRFYEIPRGMMGGAGKLSIDLGLGPQEIQDRKGGK